MHCGAEVTESSTNKQHHHHDEPLSRGLGTREEPGTLTQGACFPWLGEFFFAALDSWAGINPNLPGPYLEGPHLPIPVPCV